MNRWKMGFLVLVSTFASSVAMAAEPTVTYGVNGQDCYWNGLGSTSGGHTVCCESGNLNVDRDDAGTPVGASCAEAPPDPLPGGGTGTSTGGGASGGGGGGSGDATCDAQCQKDKKFKKCRGAAKAKYDRCMKASDDAMAFCHDHWALDTAVSSCTNGHANEMLDRGGTGIDGRSRGRIWGPISNVCRVVRRVNPHTNELEDVNVCSHVEGPNGMPWYADDELGEPVGSTSKSAWTRGMCTANGYQTGGCLAEWMDGRPASCTNGGSTSTTRNISLTVPLPIPGSSASGGVEQGTTRNMEVHVDSRTGLNAACNDLHIRISNECLGTRTDDLKACSQDFYAP